LAVVKPNPRQKRVTYGWGNFPFHCTPNHTIAAKVEWPGRPYESNVHITVLDSYHAKDNRFVRPIHWGFMIYSFINHYNPVFLF